MVHGGSAEEPCSGDVVAVREREGFVHGWGKQQHLWAAYDDNSLAAEVPVDMGSTAGGAIQVEDRVRRLPGETGRVEELRLGYQRARSADSVAVDAVAAEHIERAQLQAVDFGREGLDDAEQEMRHVVLGAESEGSLRLQARRSAVVSAAYGVGVPTEAEVALDHTATGKSL